MGKGKAWHLDREIKAALRRLDYAKKRTALRALTEWAKPRPPRPKLSVADRIRFKRWLWWKYGPECGYCHNDYDWRHALTIDHIQPISKGGAVRDIRNMVLACRPCNKAKGNTWIV